MNRLPLVLSSLAVAILAGCATENRVTSAPAPAPVAAAPVVVAASAVVAAPSGVAAPTAAPLRAGMGRIESILAVPTAAGGRTESNSTKRIVMKMDDGSMQYWAVSDMDRAAPGARDVGLEVTVAAGARDGRMFVFRRRGKRSTAPDAFSLFES